MAMLSKYLVLPDDRWRSLQLKTTSTKCQTIYCLVGQENGHHNKDKFRHLQTILKLIDNMIMINNQERNRLLSDMKTEIEHIIQSTDIDVLQEYLNAVIPNNFRSIFMILDIKKREPLCLFFLIAYHVLVASEKVNNNEILNVVKVKLLQIPNFGLQFRLDNIFQLFLDVYYKGNPKEIFTNIHNIWKSDPTTEFELKLAYCKTLIEAKDYKTLIQLIHYHDNYFIERFEVIIKSDFFITCTTPTILLLHILHRQVLMNNMEQVKTIQTLLSTITINNRYKYSDEQVLFNGVCDFILTLDNEQIICIPHLIKLLQPVMREYPFDYLKTILLSIDRLRQANHFTECIKFIKYHFQFISSFSTDKIKIEGECYYRQQYCITLLLLLNEYVSCQETHKMNMVLARLLELRVSFLSDIHRNSCYCLMGNQACLTTTCTMGEQLRPELKRYRTEFEQDLMTCYTNGLFLLHRHSQFSRKRILHSGYELYDLDFVINKVIQGELELAPFLESIIDLMGIYQYQSIVFLIEFIKRSVEHNEASLYNIIKTLCACFLLPEIQDLILQGLTAYLMISYKRQNGLLSKFILDVSMKCPNGQFLHKLTSGIAPLLTKFDNQIINDFRKIIYTCYCAVRHDSKNEKDTNITRYKDRFTFLASMEAEEEMKKLTSLTNLLLLLTLLLITSGGHHKSAELKKYLSLKYEYRDSILYLLWCSGDVEINPGPTLSTLRKVPDSVKERNWIYEMSSILLRLLKYRSINFKNNGLWKEKPLHWNPEWPFYDPRNKPKKQGYNTGTDKKLLECLEEHCHSEGLLDSSKFDDEKAKSKVRQYKMEIIAWKNDRTELFELYTLRQELDTLSAAKRSLHKYKKDHELHQSITDLNIDLIFDTDDVTAISCEGFTDIVRDIAITFCRIGKGLNLLEKSDGIWKTPPSGWNPNHSYFSPCNAGKRKEKGQDQKLVDNILTYCESKKITIPSELQALLKAWKHRNTSEITKSYTIWSKTEKVKHALQYLKLEGMLGKIHVHESLNQIGVILDTQHWGCPSVTKPCSNNNDDKKQDSGSSDHLHVSPSSDIETNSTAKVSSIQINCDNPCTKLPNSTRTNSNPASQHSLISHTDVDLCNIASEQQNQRTQSSKHICMNSCKDSCSILNSRAKSEVDGKHRPISSVNSSNSNEHIIPCISDIHDATSKPVRKNKINSKTAKKRDRPKNDESCSEPKRLHISDEDNSLLLNILTLPSENGKDLSITTPKGNSKHCYNTTILPDNLSHDLISKQTRPNHTPSEKQTDQSDDKQVDSPSCKQADNANKKVETTSDQCIHEIVNLLAEIAQDYSPVVVEPSIPKTSSTTDHPSDLGNELPEYVELCIETYRNSYNPNDTLEKDIEKFIKEQDMDLS